MKLELRFLLALIAAVCLAVAWEVLGLPGHSATSGADLIELHRSSRDYDRSCADCGRGGYGIEYHCRRPFRCAAFDPSQADGGNGTHRPVARRPLPINPRRIKCASEKS